MGRIYGVPPWEVETWPAQEVNNLLWIMDRDYVLQKAFPLEEE